MVEAVGLVELGLSANVDTTRFTTYRQGALAAPSDQQLALVEEQAVLNIVSEPKMIVGNPDQSTPYVLNTLTVMTYSETSS